MKKLISLLAFTLLFFITDGHAQQLVRNFNGVTAQTDPCLLNFTQVDFTNHSFGFCDNGAWRFAVGSSTGSFAQGEPVTADVNGLLSSSAAVRFADQYSGTTLADKINAACLDLPSTGGTIDARGLEGEQDIDSDMFDSCDKAVVVLLGSSPPGAPITVSAQQNITRNDQCVVGLGPENTYLQSAVDGDAIRIQLSTFNTKHSCELKGFTLDGSGAGNNSVGIHIGDITGFGLRNIVILDFIGTSSIGLWFDNQTNWTERIQLQDVWLYRNLTGWLFTVNGGTDSFADIQVYGVETNTANGQTAVSIEGTSDIYGGYFDMFMNDDDSAGTSTQINIADTSLLRNSTFKIFAEDTGGGGGTGIVKATGASLNGIGRITMSGLTNSFTGEPTQFLTNLGGTPVTGVLQTPFTFATRLESNNIGSYVMPQLGTNGSFRQGLGLNLHFDGSNWITEGDGSANGATGILGTYGTTASLQFFTVNSTAGTDQSISNATLNSTHERMRLTSTGLGIGTSSPQAKLDSTILNTANTFANRADSIMFHRTDLLTSFANKITNSISATPANTTMNFELTNSAGSGFTTVLSLLGSGVVQPLLYGSQTNCSDSGGAAACAAAPAGHFVIDATSTSTVVSTTAVTANSEIHVTRDDSLGPRLSVTCNTQSSLVLGTPRITARTAGVSFTVSIDLGPTTNPMCLGYTIIN